MPGRKLYNEEGRIVGFARTVRGCEHRGCGKPTAALCDFRYAGGTCDVQMCEKHRTRIGPNEDHCWRHSTETPS